MILAANGWSARRIELAVGVSVDDQKDLRAEYRERMKAARAKLGEIKTRASQAGSSEGEVVHAFRYWWREQYGRDANFEELQEIGIT